MLALSRFGYGCHYCTDDGEGDADGDGDEDGDEDILPIPNLYDSARKQNERISKDIPRILSPRIRDQTKKSELARTFHEF